MNFEGLVIFKSKEKSLQSKLLPFFTLPYLLPFLD
jgi:hypothetical protein